MSFWRLEVQNPGVRKKIIKILLISLGRKKIKMSAELASGGSEEEIVPYR